MAGRRNRTRNQHQEEPGNANDETGERTSGVIKLRPDKKEADQPILDYIDYFKKVVKVNHWNDEEAGDIFCALLGPSDRSVDSLEGQWTTFSELEKLLRSKEESMRDAHLASLMNVRLKDSENMEDLRNRMVRLVSTVYGSFSRNVQSQIARDHFLHALPGDTMIKVLAANPKSLEDTVSIAKSCVTIQNREVPVAATKEQPNQRNPFWKNENSRKRRDHLQSNSKDIQCFRCKGIGHMRKDCPSKTFAGVEEKEESVSENY
jgi:hypothetical protein